MQGQYLPMKVPASTIRVYGIGCLSQIDICNYKAKAPSGLASGIVPKVSPAFRQRRRICFWGQGGVQGVSPSLPSLATSPTSIIISIGVGGESFSSEGGGVFLGLSPTPQTLNTG